MKNLKKCWVFAAIGLIIVVAIVSAYWLIKRKSHLNVEGSPQLVVQLGHSGGISSAAFSPDGRFIVSGGADLTGRGISNNTAILWEASTGSEIRRFVGHSASINSVAFSPDGKFVLTGSGDEGNYDDVSSKPRGKDFTARLWDIETGKEIRQFAGHREAIGSVAFSPDGQFVLTKSNNIRIWNIENGTEAHSFLSNKTPINFSTNGRFVLLGFNNSNDKTIQLYDLSIGKEVRSFKIDDIDEFASVALSPDGRFLLTAVPNPGPRRNDVNDVVRLWDVVTGRVIREFPGCSPTAFSPDGQFILIGGKEREDDFSMSGAQLWNVSTGEKVRYFNGQLVRNYQGQVYEHGIVESVAFSPDGKSALIVLGELGTGGSSGAIDGEVALRLHDLASGKEIRRFESNASGVAHDLAFSSNGNLFWSGNGVWDVKASKEIQFNGYSFDEHLFRQTLPSIPNRLFSKDGRFALTQELTEGGAVILWETATGRSVLKISGSDKIAFWLSPDSHFVFFAGWGKGNSEFDQVWSLYCWEIETRREVWKFEFVHNFWIHDHSNLSEVSKLSSDGRLFAILHVSNKQSANEIILLDAETGLVIDQLKRSTRAFTFSPDNRFLVVAGSANTLIYDVVAKKVVRNFQLTTREKEGNISFSEDPPSFSPDGRFLLIYNELWDFSNGKKVQEYNQASNYAVFSPDSRFLLTYTDTVHVWEIATRKEIRRFEGNAGEVTSLTVSPDSRFVLTGSPDNTERFWDISTGQELCRLVSLRNGDWIVTTPDGRFDTNNLDKIEGMHWIMPSEPLRPLPIEIFMRQYYEPKLLARVLKCNENKNCEQEFKALPALNTLNRTQPSVKIADIKPDSDNTVEVTVEVANTKSEGQKDTFGNPLESGVSDVRLFRDGQLVAYAPKNAETEQSTWDWIKSWFGGKLETSGGVELDKGGKAVLKFPKIKLPRTGVDKLEFSAYAFNSYQIKSETSRQTYAIKPQTVKGRAYVIPLGVNALENSTLNWLRYAANDARQSQEILTERLREQGQYEEIVNIPLISDFNVLINGQTVAAQNATAQQLQTGQKILTENTATKGHFKAVLDALAGRQGDANLLQAIPNADKLRAANPEDLIIISVSSHGYNDKDGIFYIVPSDVGSSKMASDEFRNRSISSDELSLWLRDVDAGELTLIVDACHSAAAVENADFKPAPMNSRGLGQLSYDKGMRILTATQADNVAVERDNLRQGLLSYALLQNGLNDFKADFKPQDQIIVMSEWLNFGVESVPRLFEAANSGQVKMVRETVDTAEDEKRREEKTQQPSLFDFSRKNRDVTIAGRGGSVPKPNKTVETEKPKVEVNNQDTQPINKPTPNGFNGRVIRLNAILSELPAKDSRKIEIIPIDASIKIGIQKGPWFRVTTSSGVEGWMHGNDIEFAK